MQVGDALLDVIFDPDVADGAGLVIDGFPRTALQVLQPGLLDFCGEFCVNHDLVAPVSLPGNFMRIKSFCNTQMGMLCRQTS